MGSFIVFIILAIVAIAAAVGMLISRNAVHSALFLILNFTTLAVLYVVLNAPFIAMVQITVYAGAIMVLFLFVIMLLGVEKLAGVSGKGGWQGVLAGLLAAALIVAFSAALLPKGVSGGSGFIESGPTALGLRLFEAYIFPFEVTGVLLLAAMIGVVVMGRKRKEGRDA